MKRKNKLNLHCAECGQVFESYISDKRKFCSQSCAAKSNNRLKAKTAKRITKKCIYCGQGFTLLASQLKVREKHLGYKVQYCSRACFFSAIKIKPKECEYCGTTYVPQRKTTRYCSIACKSKARIGKARSAFWYENGYRVLSLGDGVGIKEHIKIMQDHIGRKLKANEVVHHRNGIRDDNRLRNLQLLTRGEHSRLHREKEKKAEIKHFGRK